MKKIICAALMLTLCLTVLAWAASPENKVEIVSAVTETGEDLSGQYVVQLPDEAAPDSGMDEVEYLLEAPEALAEDVSPELEGMTLLNLFNVEYIGEGRPLGSVTITFQVAGVESGDKVIVIHYMDGSWELIDPDNVGNGTVTATFASLSPVGFVVEKAAAPASDADASPATGDNLIIWAVIVAVCAGGAAIALAARKKKA